MRFSEPLRSVASIRVAFRSRPMIHGVPVPLFMFTSGVLLVRRPSCVALLAHEDPVAIAVRHEITS